MPPGARLQQNFLSRRSCTSVQKVAPRHKASLKCVCYISQIIEFLKKW